MVKRIIKRIFVFSSVACLVLACLPSVSFAIDPVSGAAALAGAIDAYGMAYGVGTVYDVSSSSGVSSSFEGLWDDFSEYQSNAGSQFDYDSYIGNYNQNRSLYGFEHSSGKFAAWSIDAESAEIFDQFWNWLLTGPAEMTRVDNEYFEFNQSQVGPDASPLSVFSSSTLLDSLVPYTSNISASAASYDAGYVIGYGYGKTWSKSLYNLSSGVSVYLFEFPSGTGGFQVVLCSDSSFFWNGVQKSANGTYSKDYSSNQTSYSSASVAGMYFALPTVAQSALSGIPVYSSQDVGLLAYKAAIADPSSVEADSVGVKAYGNGYVNVPDPSLPDYEPMPLEIVTNIPWDSSYDDTDEEDGKPVPFPPVDVPLVVDDIISSISSEDYALEEDPQDPDPDAPPPAPSEVFVPLLPVGLPSFNFSFSGIWHYVREWVSSLGAWFTTLFTIWGSLPYAMVVPVYATAVVVIVLGVYKRFFM